MEYRIEADGELVPRPAQRRPRAATAASSSSRATRRPRWLAAPDPGPSQPLARRRAPVVAARHRPAPPAPAARRARRQRVRARGPAHAADRRTRSRATRSRRAASRCSTRPGATRTTPRRRATPARSPPRLPALAPATAHAGIGASLGALALLHARAAPPRRVRRAAAPVGLLLPPALGPPGVGLPALPPDQRASSAASCTPARPPTPIPITLTCGAPEENLANNRAVADRAAPPGPPRRRCTSTATRTTSSAGATRSTRISSTCSRGPGGRRPHDGAHAPDRPAARHGGGLVRARSRRCSRARRPRSSTAARRTSSRPSA